MGKKLDKLKKRGKSVSDCCGFREEADGGAAVECRSMSVGGEINKEKTRNKRRKMYKYTHTTHTVTWRSEEGTLCFVTCANVSITCLMEFS
jgi:hypothetical protein